MKALRRRPTLFRYCVEEVSRARHNALFRRFIGALTRGGPGGVPRPIEAHASDPKRYVSDMLGWLHQAAAGEKELVAALLGDAKDEQKSSKADSTDERKTTRRPPRMTPATRSATPRRCSTASWTASGALSACAWTRRSP
jgi:hypothetical protein